MQSMEQVRKFDHQVAGHTNEVIRRYKDSLILKPENKKDLFRKEVKTYERLLEFYQNESPLFAKFYGILYPNASNLLPVPCIILEDLTADCRCPCLIDIKMGQQTYEPTASAEKISRELHKYPYQAEIGFRITGLKVWDALRGKYHYFDKHFGRSLMPEQVWEALVRFYYNGVEFKLNALDSSISQLKLLLLWMQTQSFFYFYCSSILIVYEEDNCKVRMIDFAHVVHRPASEEGVDEGYLHGLRNLLSALEKIRLVVECEGSAVDDLERLKSKMENYQS